MDDALAAFARDRGLSPDDARALRALVEALVASGGTDTMAIVDESSPDATMNEIQPPGAMLGRYEDLGLIGRGGTGEVRRVRDPDLRREMAMKILRPEAVTGPHVLRRFRGEAQATAQLQHPGIVPVHEIGVLDDGRVYFTMKEVRGRTLRDVVRGLHEASAGDSWRPSEDGWTFRRVVEAFKKVCEAVAYAHTRGVVHRDLKPDNVMLGAYGEVLVLDWGIARIAGTGTTGPGVNISRSASDPSMTLAGRVTGTPAYMAPEQARGTRVDQRTDVYALGAILHELLSGRPPYVGPSAMSIVMQVLNGPPTPLGMNAPRPDRPGPPLPVELTRLSAWCMAADPEARPQAADVLCDEIGAWLDGDSGRSRALDLVAAAAAIGPDVTARRARAAALRAEAAAALAKLPLWAPEADKAPLWALEDEAADLDREADLLDLDAETQLRGALTHAPDLPEAHEALAARHRAAHAEAERARDLRAAARSEVLLRRHVDALPSESPARARHSAWLLGTGALTLVTDPPGAEADLYRYDVEGRRLAPRFVRALGRTPLSMVTLPPSSYLVVLRAPGRREVRYPVQIGRLEHWDGIPPGAREPFPIHLPRLGALDPDDCYVPAGWFQCGGDARADFSLPAGRVWVRPFVIRRFPVTVAEYLDFLNGLVDEGREGEAVMFAPRERAGDADHRNAIIFGRDASGHFHLRPDADGDMWDLGWPIYMVDWFSAVACAAWTAAQTGRPWRLAAELEREKAARGADGRWYPWGDFADPTWCSMGDSAPGRRFPATVEDHPVDCSPYGVRGLAGNSKDWCLDRWNAAGPLVVEGHAIVPDAVDEAVAYPQAARAVRGGSWRAQANNIRAAARSSLVPNYRNVFIGVRLARGYLGERDEWP